jgi:hypothetical protein
MKTLKQVKQDNPGLIKLINAVVKQLGSTEQLGHIRSADNGYTGFIYYSETHQFTIKNRKAILELLNETAEQLGEDVVTMVKNFGVFRGEMDKDELKDLYIFLGEGKPEQGSVTNVLAWFALEEVNRLFED